ncbi:MAG: nitrilase [Gemmatimonadetes bacterium]|nr:nitrilase [Gemmatimonadota bacterium]MXY80973.1 nitrilase [Gemmatimonadota bacterium]MYB70074.1 nitrilase [Gemmatimonadota bacterium]
MGDELRYGVAACQVDQPNPTDRAEMARNTARMVEMVDMAVEGYGPFMDVKLLAFPEFAHAAPIYPTAKSLLAKLAVPVPNEHTARLEDKARELGVYIQTATFLEEDPQWPGRVFNTTCLLGPEGLWYKYRKVNPWVPWEVHASPHDLADYEDELFPVAQTPIGCIGAAICYDWLFPEPLRQLTANGAEILVRVSAYMDPWGATPPMDWWTTVNRCRALENTAYVLAANQGAELSHYPPFSWPGGSMVVDFDGRILAQADPGPGEKIVVSEVDIGALRHIRKRRAGHHTLAHLRSEAYPMYGQPYYPQGSFSAENNHTVAMNEERIAEVKQRITRQS